MNSPKRELLLSPDAERLVGFLRTARANSHRCAVSLSSVRQWTGIDADRFPALFIELVNAGLLLMPMKREGEAVHLYVDGVTTRKISAARRLVGLAVHPLAEELEQGRDQGADEKTKITPAVAGAA